MATAGLALLFTAVAALAQTTAPAPAPAPAGTNAPAASTHSPEKLKEFEQRFGEGLKLYQQEKYAEARAVFEGILAEAPDAKGSLFYGGNACLFMGESAKAIEYLERFRVLVPQDPRAIVHLIQANQALKRTPRVDALRRQLLAMRKEVLAKNPDRDKWDLGRPEISVLVDPMFVRERIRMQGGAVMEICEAFNYYDSPNAVYMAQIFAKDGKRLRNIYISYDPDKTAKLRKEHPNDAKYQKAEVFIYSEIFVKGEETDRIDIYDFKLVPPTYDATRKWLLEMLARPPKPVESISGDELRGGPAQPAAAPQPSAPAPRQPAAPSGQGNIAVPQDAPPVVTPRQPAAPRAPAAPGTTRPTPR